MFGPVYSLRHSCVREPIRLDKCRLKRGIDDFGRQISLRSVACRFNERGVNVLQGRLYDKASLAKLLVRVPALHLILDSSWCRYPQ